ncbi:MAG: NPCBM/NEW2 domain-containing protein [Mucilaginibacter sp.]|uniref:NPCBM/NEW2 domain-containing protein n=1 Tax=Mucilaginibacter sp. TaxID=1882438 RepID=UPI0032656E47
MKEKQNEKECLRSLLASNQLKMNTASKNIFYIAFAIIFSLINISTLSAQTVWLDQLDLSQATLGWGVPKKNRSVDGNIMTIAGKTFERGFGIKTYDTNI